MGVCHSEGKKKKENKNNTEINKNINNEIPSGDNNNNKVNLKSGNKGCNTNNKEYYIDLVNSPINNEIKRTIKGNQKLIDILKDTLKINENIDFEIELENNKVVKSNKKEYEFNEIVKEIFGSNIPDIIKMKYLNKGLDIPENVIKAYIDDNKIIGSAIIDNMETFGIITYDINLKTISSYSYKISDYPNLNNFNSFTAYCNAKNCLYFSGGESEISNDLDKTSLKYNDFFSLDLTTLNKDKLIINELTNLKEPRTWHSMIYVPNKYIFIVGGSNTKSVELYDIDEKILTKHSELNEIRCECTLCLVNNMYLYAFFGFVLHQEYNNSIERLNLLKENKKWEYVNYEKKDGLNLKLSFFGVCYFKEDELLLIGGNDNDNEERYDYNYTLAKNEEEKDIIKEFDTELKENNIVFRDKLFLPSEENKSIIIPVTIGENIRVFISDNGKINVLNQQYQIEN